MPIIAISRDWGTSPSIVRIECTDSFAEITALGYLKSQASTINILNKGAFQWAPSDLVAIDYLDGEGFFTRDPVTELLTPENYNAGGVSPRQVQSFVFNTGFAVGANDAFVVNLIPAPILTDGMIVIMNSDTLVNNTDSPTLQLNSLAPKPIVTAFGPPVPGDILQDSVYVFVYNALADNFFLVNPFLSTPNTYLIQQNFYNFAGDAGVADAYIATTVPLNASIDEAFALYLRVANTNTGASTVTVNGVLKDIVRNDGSDLQAGDMVANRTAYLLYDQALDKFVLQNPEIAPAPNPTWSVVTADTTMQPNKGYITNGGALVTLTLPATSAVGDTLEIVGQGVGGWLIAQDDGQSVRIGINASTIGATGSVASDNRYDSVKLVCTVADTSWSTVGGPQSTGLTIV
jgi:hypothetical protein